MDSGITIGRSQCLCISRISSSVNSPGWPDTPIRMVGLALRTTSSSEMASLAVSQPAVVALLYQLALEIEQVRQFVGQQAEAVDHEYAGARFVFAQAFGLHLRDDLLGDAAAGGTGAEEGDGLIAQLLPAARLAAIRLPRVTAAVPMSSLKQQISSR